MVVNKSKLQALAVELQSILDSESRQDFKDPQKRAALTAAIGHAKDDGFPRDQLVKELKDAGLGWFAAKLARGGYDSK